MTRRLAAEQQPDMTVWDVYDDAGTWIGQDVEPTTPAPTAARVAVEVDPAELDAARAAASNATTLTGTRAALLRLVDALTPEDA